MSLRLAASVGNRTLAQKVENLDPNGQSEQTKRAPRPFLYEEHDDTGGLVEMGTMYYEPFFAAKPYPTPSSAN